jgi:hypothetical protein
MGHSYELILQLGSTHYQTQLSSLGLRPSQEFHLKGDQMSFERFFRR